MAALYGDTDPESNDGVGGGITHLGHNHADTADSEGGEASVEGSPGGVRTLEFGRITDLR
nr:hypothetical; ORF1 [Lymphoproliferative disease virus]